MAVEVTSWVNGLDPTKPNGATDPKSEGDDHIKLIKQTLFNCFGNVGGSIVASHLELATLVGATGSGVTALKVATRPAGDSTTYPANTAFVANAISSATLANTSPLTYYTLQTQGVV